MRSAFGYALWNTIEDFLFPPMLRPMPLGWISMRLWRSPFDWILCNGPSSRRGSAWSFPKGLRRRFVHEAAWLGDMG